MTTYASSWAELCGLIAARVLHDPAPVMGYDLVIVPSAGHQRALSQHLAIRDDGPQIAAGLQFVQLPQLAGRLAQPLIAAGRLAEDGWRGVALQLGIIELLAGADPTGPLAPVLRHLGPPGTRPGRAHATARRLAGIFRRYANQAPELVAAWRAGRDVGLDAAPLSARDRWQPVAWRGLVELLGPDPAQRHEQLLGLLRSAAVPTLPTRVFCALVDDPTPAQSELLAALASHHEVHGYAIARVPGGARPVPEGRPTDASPATTLLARVQARLRHSTPGNSPVGVDQSFQIHACHGPGRQVEVLRDVLCGLFSDDPTLQPRDVVVLCPALGEYAPLISASFGLDPDTNPGLHPGHRLRAQLAAPAISALNPVLAVVARVFELYNGRATSVDLFDLCQMPPIAERFGIGVDDLEQVHQLIRNAQVRWGIDAAHRKRNRVPNTLSTWLAGVQRMLVSLAFDAEPFVDMKTVTPVRQIEGSDAGLIGRLAELVSRVRKVSAEFEKPAPATEWAERLRVAIDLLVAVAPGDEWQLSHAYAKLAELSEQGSGRQAELHVGDLAAWLNDQQQAGGQRPNYGNGSLIFTSLDDLATIDARVICVLGLDDTSYPGAPVVDGDSLLDRPESAHLKHWTTDRRARRQQRLRDAMLAAQEKFVVITQGADEATGAVLPIPLCIAELVELCALTGPAALWRDAGPNPLIKWHPLHAHGWADFTAEAAERPSSFDEQALQGALQLNRPRGRPVAAWQVVLREVPAEGVVDIEDLITFYTNPARSHFRRNTGTTWSNFDNPLQTSLPIELNPLETWQAGRDLFEQLLNDVPVEQASRSVAFDGKLLTDARGAIVLDELLSNAAPLADSVRIARGAGAARYVDCEVELTSCRVQGRVQLFGDRVVLHRFGDVKDEQVLHAWLQLLLLSASGVQDTATLGAVVVGGWAKQLTTPDRASAVRLLDELVQLRRSGLRTVLPLPLGCAASYVGWYGSRREPLAAARHSFSKTDAHWKFYYPDFDELLKSKPLPGDPVAADGQVGSRFEALAEWLLGPITQHRTPWSPRHEVVQ